LWFPLDFEGASPRKIERPVTGFLINEVRHGLATMAAWLAGAQTLP
jgi:hypothetical protein